MTPVEKKPVISHSKIMNRGGQEETSEDQEEEEVIEDGELAVPDEVKDVGPAFSIEYFCSGVRADIRKNPPQILVKSCPMRHKVRCNLRR